MAVDWLLDDAVAVVAPAGSPTWWIRWLIRAGLE